LSGVSARHILGVKRGLDPRIHDEMHLGKNLQLLCV